MRKRSPLAAIFLTVVVDLVGFGIVLPLLPRYALDYRASQNEIGMLMASFSAMQFLFAPVWGRVSDRIGRRPVLLVGLAGSVVFYTMFGLADSLAWLFVARIGAGICGGTISISSAYIADVTAPEQRARGMALVGAAFGIGFTLGPPLGGLASGLGRELAGGGTLPAWVGRGLPGFIAAALSAVSFLWTLRSVPEPERHGRTERKVFDLAALRDAAGTPGVLLLLLVSFLSVFAFSSFEGTFSQMLKEREGFRYDDMHAGYVFLFIGVTLVLVQGLLVRRLVPRLGERLFARAGIALMAAGLLGVAFSDSLPPLLASLAVAVTGFGATTPSLSSLISRRTNPDRQGGILGLAQSASALGRILGPWIGNLVYGGAAARPEGSALEAVFGGLPFHRRPYVLASTILAGLALISLAIRAAPDGGRPPAPAPPPQA